MKIDDEKDVRKIMRREKKMADAVDNARRASRVMFLILRYTCEHIGLLEERLNYENKACAPLFSKPMKKTMKGCDFADAYWAFDKDNWPWDLIPGYAMQYVFERMIDPAIGESAFTAITVLDDGGFGIEGRCPEPEDPGFKEVADSDSSVTFAFSSGVLADTPLYRKEGNEKAPDVKRNFSRLMKEMDKKTGPYYYTSPDGKSKLVMMRIPLAILYGSAEMERELNVFNDLVRDYTGVTDLLVKRGE